MRAGRWRAVIAVVGLALLAPAAAAPEPGPRPRPAAADLAGRAEASDGDTLRLGAKRIRLFGIDAPELGQRCDAGDKGSWPCGQIAAARLGTLVAAGPVRCVPRDRDRYGRIVATCRVGGVDIGERMVAEGLARAYTRYGADYAAVERRAKTEAIGLWRGAAEAPWDYRAEARGEPAAIPGPPDPRCTIKGNVSTSGAKVYHLPDMQAYARTRIDPRRGEAWFCDEAAAEAAGFRRARR